MQLSKFENYLDAKNVTVDDLTKEDCFRAGQIQTINDIANALGVSLTYNGLNWVDEIYRTYLVRPSHDTFDYFSVDDIDMSKINDIMDGIRY